MKTWIILFSLIIFLVIFGLTAAGLNSTLQALDYHTDLAIFAPLKSAEQELQRLYDSSDSPQIRASLEQISAHLSSAHAEIGQREVLKQRIYGRLGITLAAAGIISLLIGAALWLTGVKKIITPLNKISNQLSRAVTENFVDNQEGFKEVRLVSKTIAEMLKEIREYQNRIKQIERQNIGRFLAHQIKNSLTPIKLCAYNINTLIYQEAPVSIEQIRANNSIIGEEAIKVEQLIEQFRSITQFPAPELTEINLKDLLKNLSRLEDTINMSFPGRDIMIQADPSLLEQSIRNLINNAKEACVTNMGKVSVYTDQIDEKEMLVIQDTGTGIPASELEQIWNEYYTTKRKGMGIGLAFVKKTMEAHGFPLEIESELQKGTTIRIIYNETT